MRSSHHASIPHHKLVLAIASTAASAVAVTAILILRRRSSRGRTCKLDGKEMGECGERLEKEGLSPSDTGTCSRRITMSKSTRFPWEPAATVNANESGSDGDDDGGGGDDNVGEGKHIPVRSNREARLFRDEMKSSPAPHNQQQKDQLDFLASMTFASSNLRQPNCPCCI